MSTQIPYIHDRRGFLFTIDHDVDPVYQVESSAWAEQAHRWNEADIPQSIRDKMAQLEQNGKPGAFVRFLQGEVGVYVLCEKNIKTLPEPADEEVNVDAFEQNGNGRQLSPYDIVIRAKGGTVHTESGETFETQEGDYYVIPCQVWGRYILEEPKRPDFVEVTKKMLALLQDLNGHNYLAMSPDKPEEALPPNMAAPQPASFGIACYVLKLFHFKR